MKMRVAINGFGRIGRLVLRSFLESGRDDLDFVAINDLGSAKMNAHLLEYDTIHGQYTGPIKANDKSLKAGPFSMDVFSEVLPEKLPWRELDIDLVLECTGRFANRNDAARHIKAGAKRVLVSAPCTDADLTVVYGVNHNELRQEHHVVSNGSCTTNCLAPVVKVLNDAFGIERGYMTTIHSYTGDQRTVDTCHSDYYRARGAASNLIPTSTGAARAIGIVLPEMAGKLDGSAIRVPTPNVSLVDFKFNVARDVSVEDINTAIEEASENGLTGVLAVNDKPLVSSDFNHHPASSIFDINSTQVVDKTFCRIVSWYDNEWGFANRMGDTAAAIGRLL